jgi:hypothetical protein
MKYRIPGPEEAGYLKRQRKAADFWSKMGEMSGPESYDAMVDFLVDFVEEPEDREAAKEALWELSENDYRDLIDKVMGRAEPDPKESV